MTAEIINQRHFWKDIGSSSFLYFLMVGLKFFPKNLMIFRSGIHGPKESDQGRINEKSKTRLGPVNWRSVDPYLRLGHILKQPIWVRFHL